MNDFRDALIKRGVVSGSQLAEHLKSPAVIFFFAGGGRPYAELRFWDDIGDMSVSKHWPPQSHMTLGEIRRETVEAAKNEAANALALPNWTRAPFSNCWLPAGVLTEARQEFLGPEAA